MSDLVQRLSEGQHPVEVTLRPERTVKALQDCIDRGYIHIKFTNTRGGTELGVPIDRQRTDLTKADFAKESGRFSVSGELTLDYVKVRCVADIELPSLQGQGHLEPIAEAAPAPTA
jgi:hypothetical protein